MLQIWNRHEWRKHPDTGNRHPRQRPEKEWVITEAPELRIIDDSLWQRVKDLQAKRGPAASAREKSAANVRNRYLLSGLVRCGFRGAPLIRTGRAGYACATARNRGRDQCRFTGTPNRQALEATVLEAWRKRLFTEENLQPAIEAMRDGLKRRAAEAKAARGDGRQAQRLREVEREIGNVMAAIRAGGTGDAASLLREDLNRLAAERDRLAAEGDTASASGPDEKAVEAALA